MMLTRGQKTHIHLVFCNKSYLSRKLIDFRNSQFAPSWNNPFSCGHCVMGKTTRKLYSFWCPGEITRPEDKQKNTESLELAHVSTCCFSLHPKKHMFKTYLPQVGSFDMLHSHTNLTNPQGYVKKGRRSVIYVAGCDAGGFGVDSDLQLNPFEAPMKIGSNWGFLMRKPWWWTKSQHPNLPIDLALCPARNPRKVVVTFDFAVLPGLNHGGFDECKEGLLQQKTATKSTNGLSPRGGCHESKKT